MTGSTIYNATDGPLAIDRAGRMLAARERREDISSVEGSPLAGHIEAERIVVLELASPTNDVEDGNAEESDMPADDQPPTTTTRARKGARTQEA